MTQRLELAYDKVLLIGIVGSLIELIEEVKAAEGVLYLKLLIIDSL